MILQKALSQCTIYGLVSPVARIHRSRNQGMEMEIVPFTITFSDSLEKRLLPVSVTLGSPGLDILVPDWGVFLLGNTINIPLSWKLRHPTGCFRYLMLLNQKARKEITVLGGMIYPEYPGELEFLFHNGDKEDYVWGEGNLFGITMSCD